LGLEQVDNETAFDATWDILAESVGDPTLSGRERLRALYLGSPAMALFCWPTGGSVAGVIGALLDGDDPAAGKIRHIAVSRALRQQGLCRRRIAALSLLYPGVRTWSATTDGDAMAPARKASDLTVEFS